MRALLFLELTHTGLSCHRIFWQINALGQVFGPLLGVTLQVNRRGLAITLNREGDSPKIPTKHCKLLCHECSGGSVYMRVRLKFSALYAENYFPLGEKAFSVFISRVIIVALNYKRSVTILGLV